MPTLRTQFHRMLTVAVTVSVCSVCSVVPCSAGAQSSGVATPAPYATIREADIRADMFAMAGDGMRGREAGTLDEMRASMWVADQLRTIGLAPKGEDGT